MRFHFTRNGMGPCLFAAVGLDSNDAGDLVLQGFDDRRSVRFIFDEFPLGIDLSRWEDGSSEGFRPKQSTCGLSSRTATHQCGLQHLHCVLSFVEGGDGVDVQIHT